MTFHCALNTINMLGSAFEIFHFLSSNKPYTWTQWNAMKFAKEMEFWINSKLSKVIRYTSTLNSLLKDSHFKDVDLYLEILSKTTMVFITCNVIKTKQIHIPSITLIYSTIAAVHNYTSITKSLFLLRLANIDIFCIYKYMYFQNLCHLVLIIVRSHHIFVDFLGSFVGVFAVFSLVTDAFPVSFAGKLLEVHILQS